MMGNRVTLRLVEDNPPDLPLTQTSDWEVFLPGTPRPGDEIADRPGHYVVTRVIWRAEDSPLCVVSRLDLPEQRGAPYRPAPAE